jgi:soluble lytic murein transglycosylase-like protein
MKNTIILAALASALVMLGLQYGVLDAPAPPEPILVSQPTEASIKEEVKIERYQKRLQRATKVVARVYRKVGCSQAYTDATARAAVENDLSPSLLAGLVFVESSCNPRAKDGRGSFGLTQVNSKVWGNQRVFPLYDPEFNLRVGASILASYVRRFGLVEGLHHYNGYSDVHEHIYVKKVLTAAGLV